MSFRPTTPRQRSRKTGAGFRASGRLGCLVSTALLGMALSTQASRGYLVDGPPRLRFQDRQVTQQAAQAVVPPPILKDPTALAKPVEPLPLSTNTPPPALLSAESSPAPTAPPVAPLPGTSLPGTAGVTPIYSPAAPLLTPQSLIPYFVTSDSNQPGFMMVNPVSFIPPHPGTRSVSKGTYTVTP